MEPANISPCLPAPTTATPTPPSPPARSTTGPAASGWRSMSALNLEWFSFGEGLGAELAPGGPQPDVLNYAWRDYGNRVGVFRLADLFAELKLPVSLLVNAADVSTTRRRPSPHFPGAEIVGHGRSNSERQGDLTEYEERVADRGNDRGDREAFRPAPARLARALDLAIAAHARSPAGGRLPLSARLVP